MCSETSLFYYCDWLPSFSAGFGFALHSTTHTMHTTTWFITLLQLTQHTGYILLLKVTFEQSLVISQSVFCPNYSFPLIQLQKYQENTEKRTCLPLTICSFGCSCAAQQCVPGRCQQPLGWWPPLIIHPSQLPLAHLFSVRPTGFSPGRFSPAATSAARWLRRSWSWGTAPWLNAPWQHLNPGGVTGEYLRVAAGSCTGIFCGMHLNKRGFHHEGKNRRCVAK